MKRLLILASILLLVAARPAVAEDRGDPETHAGAETVPGGVRVTVVRSGGVNVVRSVSSGSAGSTQGCGWSLQFAPELDDAPYGMSPGPMPDPAARFALLLCDGRIMRPIWVAPADVVDLDALAWDVAQRYIEDVLAPRVRIGVNPAARGLVGLDSWFWIEGFDGSVTAPPIAAYGLSIDVRLTGGSVTWDFGDGTTETGDLGRAYPAESTVQHVHQRDGAYGITATIELVPEYRVGGGPWLTLPNLQATAATTHPVEERQAVITDT